MTGRLLMPATDWRARRRAAERPPPAQTPRREDRIEFEETEPTGQDGGWTVGYLDVLLLLVTLFAALLGTTYLQMGESQGLRAEAQPPLTTPDSADTGEAITRPMTTSASAAETETKSATSERPEPAAPEVAAVDTEAASDATAGPEAAPAIASVPSLSDEADSPLARAEPTALDPGNDPPAVAQTTAVHTDPTGPPTDPSAVIPLQFQPMLDLFAKLGERQGLELLLDRHELRLEVGDGILFPSGTAELAETGRALIAELVTALDDERLRISVEGHTDDVPIQTARFPSNWELSSIRATTVARELFAQGIPQHRVRVTGFADTRPRAPNDSAANRALNRRVSLVLEMRDDPLAQALADHNG